MMYEHRISLFPGGKKLSGSSCLVAENDRIRIHKGTWTAVYLLDIGISIEMPRETEFQHADLDAAYKTAFAMALDHWKDHPDRLMMFLEEVRQDAFERGREAQRERIRQELGL
jgi:hypothetical protein